jgi:hypothetical protein
MPAQDADELLSYIAGGSDNTNPDTIFLSSCSTHAKLFIIIHKNAYICNTLAKKYRQSMPGLAVEEGNGGRITSFM